MVTALAAFAFDEREVRNERIHACQTAARTRGDRRVRSSRLLFDLVSLDAGKSPHRTQKQEIKSVTAKPQKGFTLWGLPPIMLSGCE